MNSVHVETVVQQQLDAYNRRDLEGWLATYAEDAKQYLLPGELLAAGHAQIRARMTERFNDPDLHAELLSRTVMGQMVVDHERVTRHFPQGLGQMEMLCVYKVDNNKIVEASFVFGEPIIR